MSGVEGGVPSEWCLQECAFGERQALYFSSSMGLRRNWSSVGACAAILHGIRLSVVPGWCVPMPSALTQPPDWIWEQFLQALSCSCQSGYKEWVLSVGLCFFSALLCSLGRACCLGSAEIWGCMLTVLWVCDAPPLRSVGFFLLICVGGNPRESSKIG